MLVICEGHKYCGRDCEHGKIHEHQDEGYYDDNDDFIASCNQNCCIVFPYHCTHECYTLYMRKEKLKKLSEL